MNTVSRIKVFCDCGNKFLVRPYLADRQAVCPVCARTLDICGEQEPKTDLRTGITCPHCGKDSWEQLTVCRHCTRPLRETDPYAGQTSPLGVVLTFMKLHPTLCLTVAAPVVLLVLGFFQMKLDGPQFLLVYFAFGLFWLVGGLVATAWNSPAFRTAAIAVITYETLGLIRIVYGTSQGMQRFSILYGMMIGGPVLYFFLYYTLFGAWPRSHGRSSEGSGNWWRYGGLHGGCGGSSCGSGGGCGGGGCGSSSGGGGGCGGCGGD